jgi:lactoylglutathione lyase
VTSTERRINKVSTVVIPVADQERAIEFYTQKLGFEKRVDVPFGPEEGYRWVELAPAEAVTTIAVVPPPPGGSTATAKRASDYRPMTLTRATPI